jgi:hypothetical protein
MYYKLTRTEDGGELEVYAGSVVIAVYDDKKVYLHSTTGIKSYMRCSFKDLKEWLDDNGIRYFHIDTDKVACRPHVLGYRRDDTLIYNQRFYAWLPDAAKALFDKFTFKHSFKTKWRDMVGN